MLVVIILFKQHVAVITALLFCVHGCSVHKITHCQGARHEPVVRKIFVFNSLIYAIKMRRFTQIKETNAFVYANRCKINYRHHVDKFTRHGSLVPHRCLFTHSILRNNAIGMAQMCVNTQNGSIRHLWALRCALA